MIFYLLKEKSMKIKRSDLEAIIKEEIIDTLSEQVGDAADRALPAAMQSLDSSMEGKPHVLKITERKGLQRNGYIVYGANLGQPGNFPDQASMEKALMQKGLIGKDAVKEKQSNIVLAYSDHGAAVEPKKVSQPRSPISQPGPRDETEEESISRARIIQLQQAAETKQKQLKQKGIKTTVATDPATGLPIIISLGIGLLSPSFSYPVGVSGTLLPVP